jgi:hypothetical protein
MIVLYLFNTPEKVGECAGGKAARTLTAPSYREDTLF